MAQETERADIGKALHDNVNQILGATRLFIKMAKPSNNDSDMYLNKASGMVYDVIEEIRRISKAPVSQYIGLVTLGERIQMMLDDLAMVHPAKIKFIGECIEQGKLDAKMQLIFQDSAGAGKRSQCFYQT